MSRSIPALVLLLLAGGIGETGREALFEHRNLGKAFYENPATAALAVEEFGKALATAPESAREHVNYGLALIRAGRTDEGVAQLERVQRQNPSLPHTWFNLGIVYKQRGDWKRATVQFRHMVELVPGEPVSHYNLAYLFKQQGDIEGALREFQTAAKLDAGFAAPLYQLFTTYREQRRPREAAVALERFNALRQRREREGHDTNSEDVNWSAYAEVLETIEPAAAAGNREPQLKFEEKRLAAQVDPQTAGMLVLNSSSGRPSLLVWSKKGILLFRNGTEAVDVGLSGARDVLSVASGDYNNDGLTDLCVITANGASLYLNRGEQFEKQAAPLPQRRFNKALWLDYDHDYDLDLVLLGDRPALFQNRGAAGFEDHTADFPFVQGEMLDAAVFRIVPDSKSNDLVVSYSDQPGVVYRDRLAGGYEAQPFTALPAGATGLAAFDTDNDGWVDLAFGSGSGLTLLMNRRGNFEPKTAAAKGAFLFADLENRGRGDLVAGERVLRNGGMGRFTPEEVRLPDAAVWAEADFDGDGRADMAAVASDGSLHLFMNRTETPNQWLGVRLTGVKNTKLAPGSEVEVKAGEAYQKKIYQGKPLLFGTGAHRQVDVVRVTWPNGLIQNETRQPAGRVLAIQEAQRLSGSCPMIFTWDGRQFRFLTDVLGVAPLGASSGDGQYFAVDHDEYVQISGEALIPVNGRYEIRITEELSEVTYLDQVRLIALDHPRDLDVFTNEKWKGPPFPEFRLFGVRRRVYPVAARDSSGHDVLPALVRKDGSYAGGFRRNAAGAAEMHSLELDFGRAAADDRAVLILNGWVDWADGSTFRAASQESAGGLAPPYLQVKDGLGVWRTVVEDMGMPSGKTKTIAVDLTGKFAGPSRQVRIVTSMCVYWDEIFLGEDTEAPPARLTPAAAVSAALRFRGFSHARIHPQRLEPEHFDYTKVEPASMWNQTPGMYTRYGNVRELLEQPDDRFVIMGSGDELRLAFDAAAFPALPAGWTRDFLLFVDGWAKDRDANTAWSQTVEPLPFHGMSRYPYAGSERFPQDRIHRLYGRMYNTRPAARLIRPLNDGLAP